MFTPEAAVEPVGCTEGVTGGAGGVVAVGAGLGGGAAWGFPLPGRRRKRPSPTSASTVIVKTSMRWRDVNSMRRYFFRRIGRSQNGFGPADSPLPLPPPLPLPLPLP